METLETGAGMLYVSLHRPYLARHQDALQRRGIRVLEVGESRLLGEVPDVPRAEDRPLRRLEVTDESAHQRGLARTVTANEPDAVSGLHAEGDIPDQGPDAGIYSDVARYQHGL